MKKYIVIIILVVLAVIAGIICYFVFKQQPAIEFTFQEELKEEPVFNPENAKWKRIITEGDIWSGRDAQGLAVFNDKIWLSGGVEGGIVIPYPVYENIIHPSDLWKSSDLKNWNLVSDNVLWGQRRSMVIIPFNGKLWLMGGWDRKDGKTKNDIWVSQNGTDWEKVKEHAEWAPREGHTIVELDNTLWLMGGVDFLVRKTFNDVWYSKDGENWHKIENNALWSKRYDHAAAVFNNEIWITGGIDFGSDVKGDVWRSKDGINWEEADIPLWPARHGHLSFGYKGYLWVIGGWCEDEDLGGLNDTWYTENGKDWNQLKSKTEWSGREDHVGVIWNDKIIMMAGMADEGKTWEWKNDIWELTY